jgi:hypothetical protein
VDATYLLRRHVAGLAHVAQVTVDVQEISAADQITVSPSAFDWRVGAYGPNAILHMTGDDALKSEAVEGVGYVLDRIGDRAGGYIVEIRHIWCSYTDTSAGDVKLAAALALCQALDVTLDPPPSLTAEGHTFPY